MMQLASRTFPLFLPLILLSGGRFTGVEKVEGQYYDYYRDDELSRSFCGLRNTCCKHRQDECSLDRDGGRTKCYCDEFCERSHLAPHQDCCWDYWTVCRNVSEIYDQDCIWNNNRYRPNAFFQMNCNECQCLKRGRKMEIMCSYNKKCLVDQELITKVNQENRGWRAGNVTTFWGKTLNDGLQGLLGTNYSSNKVRTMFPVRTLVRRHQLPGAFDWRQKNPNYVSPIEDQNFCNSSWVYSIVSTFSDRLAKWSAGRERGPLSYQQLLTCSKGQRRKTICSSGFLTKSWKYIMVSGLTTSACYPRSTDARCQIQERGLGKRESVGCPGGGVEKLYRASALSRIASNESAIRREIYDNGPVIATMRVFPEFFVYNGGVYNCPRRPPKQGSVHSVKLLGWGEDSRQVPYWIAANSWGREWGEDGFFRIRRGSNECDIEEFILTFSLERRLRPRRNAFNKRLATNSSFYSPKTD
ncbi:tubulointerstitial nephritis antigen-like [Halyomorpha halys]|uniref:tubulointerstitial nephritis antigen-like n=1 Tax=Halyomorpha halys TaxID=286706 RepID=UPI0006D4F96D|nr:tubulointerstitial nephritis antigen-like [Halyomorpha halys]